VSEAYHTEEDQTEFRKLAHDMIERHRTMFPELHEDRRA
jgi:hypothetical protein